MNQHLERLAGCHPIIRRPVLALIEDCEKKLKRKLMIVHGFRSMPEQMALYQKGRMYDATLKQWFEKDPKLVVTRSLPGLSAHNVITAVRADPASMAVDLIPLDAAGNPDWQANLNFWQRLYGLAWDVGLDPLGDPIGSYLAGDMGHLEEPSWQLKLDGLGCIQPVSVTAPGPTQI
jgi:hypothetical protein